MADWMDDVKRLQGNEDKNRSKNKSTFITHRGIDFKSKLEIEWYDLFRDVFPDQVMFYEPGKFERFYPYTTDNKYDRLHYSYRPDFVIMPKKWRPVNGKSWSDEIKNKGIFIETKPDINKIIQNEIQLVESDIIMIYGYPTQSFKIFVIRTLGNNDRNEWKYQEFDNVIDAFNFAQKCFSLKNTEPTPYYKRSLFHITRKKSNKKDGMRA